MRLLLLAVLVPTLAQAEARIDVHVGGGMDGGSVHGAVRPDGVAEAGIGASFLLPQRRWGFGVLLERVGRLTEGEPIREERKLDVMARYKFSDGSGYMSFGMGLRWLMVGENDEPRSTVAGYDLFRMHFELPIRAAGPFSLDFYIAWSFGIYRGEIVESRFGDMAYPRRDYRALTTAYVLGLQGSFTR